MPHRDIVAGLTTDKFSHSNIILMLSFSFTLSPFDKHNTRESSNTVFIFSHQNGSTGPLKQVQLKAF